MEATSGVVIGAGGHALVCIEVLLRSGHEVAGCVSADGLARADIASLGVDMIGTVDELDTLLVDGRWAFVAVGDNAARHSLIDRVTSLGAELVPAISPDAVVSRSAMVEAGALVMPGAVVNAHARIGLGSIVNTGAIVDHECSIGAFSHVAPRVALAGAVSVGEETLVGIGSTVLPGVAIGARVIVGAGAVVIGDVEDGSTVVGVPARVITSSAQPTETPGGVGTWTRGAEAPESGLDDAVDSAPPIVPKVLVVCTGNLNRSPLTEVLLRRALDEIGVEAEVTSGGLSAPAGSRVDSKLLRVARELGVGDEIEAHRATQLTPAHLRDADLIVAMTREH
ncbi:NeuD/PglB/VioB family sugar acetyltransferase, partial [Ilumatobacter sp.]|uniref:NeuD/PglB/VioB family sugar acetyltransferase n=1 Tax=Ilumatobacter sp. TaxID=1967498 RepID=UPI003C439D3C